MNFAIEVLTERLDKLDSAFKKYVTEGTVEYDCWSAIDNRQKAEGLRMALKALESASPLTANALALLEQIALNKEVVEELDSHGLDVLGLITGDPNWKL